MNQIATITDAHNEALEEFGWHFGDYGFKTELIVDPTIPNYNGSEYQTVAIKITDPDSLPDCEWVVMFDEENKLHYNVYEDHTDEISSPEEMWKYMYFEATSQLRKAQRR